MDASSLHARARFPAGLEQPPGSYRFGSDALLLGAWAARCLPPAQYPQELDVADLGCGCGAALFALLLHPLAVRRKLRATGLEQQPALVDAATRNARALGLDACRFRQGDLRDNAFVRSIVQDSAPGRHLVLCNPPYGLTGHGRATSSGLRRQALQQDQGSLPAFCRAGAALLRHHGRFLAIFPAAHMARLLLALQDARLGLRQLLPVQARAHEPALRLLVEASKDAAPDCRLLPPLCLHAHHGEHTTWSREALDFCPWLAGSRNPADRG